jgi:biotin synthase
MNVIKGILAKESFTESDLVRLLNANEDEKQIIFQKAFETKKRYLGNRLYLRALMEISNICKKECYYCGIRKGNANVNRYDMPEKEVEELIRRAYNNNYNSIVIQTGELTGEKFTAKVARLVNFAGQFRNRTGITLSCGEQTVETYKKWYDAGAERYLLRIETSNRELYKKIHPDNALHDFDKRLEALKSIKKSGYQTGSGVMIGLPFQTLKDIAADLLFMQELDIDMCGMGPYIENGDTPLYAFKDMLLSLSRRAELTIIAIALLRIMMKDINIAATTALHTINHNNIAKAIKSGANVIMPNITPYKYRSNYILYKNKLSINNVDAELKELTKELEKIDHVIDFSNLGTSIHYLKRIKF